MFKFFKNRYGHVLDSRYLFTLGCMLCDKGDNCDNYYKSFIIRNSRQGIRIGGLCTIMSDEEFEELKNMLHKDHNLKGDFTYLKNLDELDVWVTTLE